MTKTLIVNADDGNLTPGVTRAILDCYDRGILSSMTWMVNLPQDEAQVNAVTARKGLGVGLHLNLTFGTPVSKPESVRSLLTPEGQFRKVGLQLAKLPLAADARKEYRAQIEKFRKIFNRLPTHLDTHHQVHDHPFYLALLADISNDYKRPLRRSKLLAETLSYDFHFLTTDFLWGDLDPAGYWRKAKLENTLKNLPDGVSEIMCHPGRNDKDLQAVSSFTTGRAEEAALFAQPAWRKFLQAQGIRLSHFGLCYT